MTKRNIRAHKVFHDIILELKIQIIHSRGNFRG